MRPLALVEPACSELAAESVWPEPAVVWLESELVWLEPALDELLPVFDGDELSCATAQHAPSSRIERSNNNFRICNLQK